jgi:hypothetical protein
MLGKMLETFDSIDNGKITIFDTYNDVVLIRVEDFEHTYATVVVSKETWKLIVEKVAKSNA